MTAIVQPTVKRVAQMRFLTGICLAFFFSLTGSGSGAPVLKTISLDSSEWRFAMDPDDVGTSQSWWTRDLEGRVKLPGSMTESGLGDDITSSTPWTEAQPRLEEMFKDPKLAQYLQPGNVKIPFWLTPLKYYKGAAWYQREFTIPSDWADKRITLHLERPHWRTDVWVDGKAQGYRDSLSTPHEYELGQLAPAAHRVSIRVDNRMQAKVGLNAHSVTDHTQTNWNGIVGDIELRPRGAVRIARVRVDPDLKANGVRFYTDVQNSTDDFVNNWVRTTVRFKNDPPISNSLDSIASQTAQSTRTAWSHVPMSAPLKTWDEFSPNVYQATVDLITINDDQTTALADSRTFNFGVRDFATSGTQFIVNGRPTFLRGTLECCIFPLTGYPPTDVAPWARIMRILKAHGLNHIRFHSWCPPEAAFLAADEAGVYFSIECASWSKDVGDPDYMRWLNAETGRIINEYGNHPSFCMLLYGNEPGGETKEKYMAALDEYVGHWKKADFPLAKRSFLVSGGAGWPWLKNNEFYITQNPRIQHWGEGLKSRVNAKPPETVTDYEAYTGKFGEPVISHEIGQWCVYPRLDERVKYTGVTRALNFDIFEDSLTKNHMRDQADDFVMASGKLQSILYKEDIESALRTYGMGGFQLLDLHDFPGQGTALVGVLDPFWDSKGYISADEYKSFTGPIVPLASLSKRVFTNDENLTCTVELANYSSETLKGAGVQWKLVRNDGRAIASGEFAARDYPVGNGLELGTIDQPLGMIKKAEQLKLTVSISDTDAQNSWDVWVYPTQVSTKVPDDVLLAHSLDDAAMERLKQGGKVLLIPDADAIKGDANSKIESGFSSIFWNTAWTGGQPPHTLGILCNPKHPALASFPTESHSNWQWWYLCHNSPVMLLDALDPAMRPIIQMIDDWTTNHRLGYLFEGKYHGGKLLVCSMALDKAGHNDPVSRQMLHSLLDYVKSDNFDPEADLSAKQLGGVLELSGMESAEAGRQR